VRQSSWRDNSETKRAARRARGVRPAWRVRAWWVAGVLAAWCVASPSPTFAQAAAGGQDEARTEEEAGEGQADPELSPYALSAEQKRRLDQALAVLRAEAMGLDKIDPPEQTEQAISQPTFNRPHPELASWGSQMAIPTLQAMARDFTTGDGKAYRDTYIRWHLIEVVKQARVEDRADTGARLLKLIRQMPGPLVIPRRPEYRHVPEEIYRQWYRLRQKTYIRTGYPPFYESHWGREAIPHHPPSKQTEIEQIVERMEELRPQWRRLRSQENIRFNRRVDRINELVRRYRGELIYELIRTGDPSMLRRVNQEIRRQVRQKQSIAFDLLSYAYLAVFEGVMTRYDRKTLQQFGAELKSTARAAEGYESYGTGAERDWDRPVKRNFADYAFHMVHMMENIGTTPLPGQRGDLETGGQR